MNRRRMIMGGKTLLAEIDFGDVSGAFVKYNGKEFRGGNFRFRKGDRIYFCVSALRKACRIYLDGEQVSMKYTRAEFEFLSENSLKITASQTKAFAQIEIERI